MVTPSNSAPKPHRHNQSKRGAVKHIYKKSKKKPKQGGRLGTVVAIAVLLSSAGLIVTFAWISIQLILNPYQVSWFNKLVPEWAQISLNNTERSQTFKQIQASLDKQGLVAGKILPLEGNSAASFLLPIFKERSHCQTNCQSIVELRVYQRSQDLELQPTLEKYYHLANQLPIIGPEESFVVSPFVNETDDNQGSSLSLPLDEVGRFEGETPSPGFWFYLQGHRQQGINIITYGYIVHYNPKRSHLQLMIPWTSPNGHFPQWRQVTGSREQELTIDRTIGLEPQLKIYQIKPVKSVLNPMGLEAIALTPPALKNLSYQDALLLARSGLWTPAYQRLRSFKKQHKGIFSAAAQAQMDVIHLHSQLTATQADTSWASPSQQVVVYIIDGRWEKALQVFEASPQNAQEIASQLKADGGRLWNRVEAELQVNPKRQSALAWGGLIIAAKNGKQRASAWLREQPEITEDSIAQIQKLLGQL
ncbi:MAG: hypothetical protein SAK29_21475 [Scytonema sp. PMC 1069.18]|nr:hypothetical protein [Scytonema sp. PMC 1069.18]MEC4880510.1 hypothetical protein [Scytonema sp. PMC 1070.18]